MPDVGREDDPGIWHFSVRNELTNPTLLSATTSSADLLT